VANHYYNHGLKYQLITICIGDILLGFEVPDTILTL